ncbi:TetR/AcrR family transcriptional regulator [Demequina sp. NBRC 110053]|uniref:TetR/AcrR family transcriptional regulator n=1 Tax=Demequina sp. NBRC 110053 TaxID=1570342 RepID=UPI0009FC8FFF|nr:TetR/AcrR family transcriptional regulator [Demequina sp. NBRC 110053]
MSEPEPLDGRQQRGRDTRAHIIAAATEQFCESGYRAGSLRDIAARAGMTHPGVLYHFPTKEALLMAVLEHRDQQGALDNPVRSELGREALRSMVGSAEKNETQRPLVELFTTLSAEATSADHPAHDYFRGRYERLLASLVGAYAVAREAGDLVEGVDPEIAGAQLIALLDGLQVQWLLGTLPTSMAAVVAAHLHAQLRAPLEFP